MMITWMNKIFRTTTKFQSLLQLFSQKNIPQIPFRHYFMYLLGMLNALYSTYTVLVKALWLTMTSVEGHLNWL